ncbi:hypothetical protein BT93_D0613 [Corymbia citriodora subsp. variegata]|nr:hypothetical protein BT93_D0613 [Corymbia citriodora subsp. variegata]
MGRWPQDRSKPAHLLCIRFNMPTIKQLIRNTRQPIRNVTKSPLLGDVLSVEEHVLGCMCDSFRSPLVEKRERNFPVSMISTIE